MLASLGFNAAQLPNSRHYGYDAAGRLIQMTDDSDPGLNQRHDYDGLDRLTGSERGEPAQSRIDYSYDLNGNRTGKVLDNTTVYNYDTAANSNRLQSQSGAQAVNYSYDELGNLTGDGTFTHSYGYNGAGRRYLTTVNATGQTIGYGYNALGQRVSKTMSGVTTRYFYDEQGHLAGEYTGSGQLIQEIVWLGDLPLAVLRPNGSAIAIYYIHADTLGTPRQISRPGDNKVVWAWESEAFGDSLPNQDPSGLGTFVFNLRFPGQYYDAETGLHYNYFRDYDPRIGRYSQSDPIGLEGGLNTYGYVGGNPVNFIDPLGLERTVGNGQRIIRLPDGTPFPNGGEGVVSMDGAGSPLGVAETVSNLVPEVKFPAAIVATVHISKALPLAKLADHHIFPQKYRKFFEKCNINIDDHTVTLGQNNHLKGIHGKELGDMPGKWNDRWAEFIANNPNATAKDVYQYAGKLMDEFGLSGSPIHGYRK